ncbi:MAG TPA: hypothetical protein PKJ33_03155 [Alphaproteobacteria bacterium]|nr:hypothetical protein [Alphaproteobacteria bacterium]
MIDHNTDEKIQAFFVSVIETLELSKLYVFDEKEKLLIQKNIELVRKMFNFREYFKNKPNELMFSYGFRNFEKNGNNYIFSIFLDVIAKISKYCETKNNSSVTNNLLNSLEVWDKIKPNGIFVKKAKVQFDRIVNDIGNFFGSGRQPVHA